MILNKIWLKIFNKNKYNELKSQKSQILNKKLFESNIKNKLSFIDNVLKNKNEINFLHSGHLGDVINSLPLIREIAKDKKCNLFVERNKPIPLHAFDPHHPLGKFYLTDSSVNKLLPLLSKQDYLNKVEIFSEQEIDIDLNLIRNLPINFNIDSVRWYFHITGIHGDLTNPYLNNIDQHNLKNKIIIIRTKRRQNNLINYTFLNKYKDILFLGLKDEYDDLKKEIPSMEFYDCKDFLEMAQIIQSCRIFIGNLSFGYTLAEALKKPRLLESGANFPLVYPNGKDGYDFYFQNHFESNFKKIFIR